MSGSAPAAAGTHRLAKKTFAETSIDSASVEVIVTLPTKHNRPQAVSSRNDDHLPVLPYGNGKHYPHTPASPHRKRWRVVDEHEQDESDDSKIEIAADAPRKLRRVPRAMPYSPSGRQLHRHKPRRVALQHRASTPPPHKQSSPITPPNVNSLAGVPLTILQKPARMEIMIPPCTFSHLQAFHDLQTTGPCAKTKCKRCTNMRSNSVFTMRRLRSVRTVSPLLHPLLPRPAVLVPLSPTPPRNRSLSTVLHANPDLHLDLSISADLRDGPVDADPHTHRVVVNAVLLHCGYP
ncbi:hypothetical protein H4582DRAFT_495789 [Lactarius indigo]|nr:hypothetical protein H4582DRAFT_495789 [Lactarius indigo]